MAYRTAPYLPLTSPPKQKKTDRQPKSDVLLLLLIFLLAALGTAMICSASYANALARYGDAYYFIKRQLLWLVIGLAAMYFFSRLPISFYRACAPYAYAITSLFLVAVLLLGQSGGGAKRWIAIGSLTFQPSELAKTTLCMMLAYHFSKHKPQIIDTKREKERFLFGTLIPLAYIGLFCGLIALEKHLSCIIILGFLGALLLFAGGSRPAYLGIFGALGGIGVGALALFTDYTKRRILIWQNPAAYPLDGGWQTLQGMMAIGSGGLFGLGFGNSRLKYSYASEPQNDFIFTITCEELGFIGAALILLLFAVFFLRGIKLAKHHSDPFASLMTFGIVAKVGLQVLLNVAVVTNAIPNTGISLPFFSYGGASLLILFMEMGMLLSFSRTANVPI